MADFDYTFGGQLTFDILPRSFATDIDMEAIQRDILATRENWTDEEKGIVYEIAILLSGTRSAKIVGKKKPASVVEMVEGINNRLPVDELLAWRQRIPHKLVIAWNNAWIAGQDIFDVDPAQLPTADLSITQREELKDKNSFLASPV